MTAPTQDDSDRSRQIKLRYAGTCRACGLALRVGWRAHHFPARKQVQCTRCGPTLIAEVPPAPDPDPTPPEPEPTAPDLPTCPECGRRLEPGDEPVACRECVILSTTGVLGTPGAAALREHARRQSNHEERLFSRSPLLGAIGLAVFGDPQHVKAWKRGAGGEQRVGRRLSRLAGADLKVLHDRRLPYSRANVDHLVVTSRGVWVLDTKRYRGKLAVRSRGPLWARRKDLYVAGRKQNQLVDGVKWQVSEVKRVVGDVAGELSLPPIPVLGALVFVDIDLGFMAGPWSIDDIEVTWSREVRRLLRRQTKGPLPVEAVARRLARFLPAA